MDDNDLVEILIDEEPEDKKTGGEVDPKKANGEIKPAAKEPPKDDDDAEIQTGEEGIEELKKSLEDRTREAETAKARAVAAERAAEEASRDASRFRTDAERYQYGEIVNGLDSAKNMLAAAKKEFRQAFEAQDPDKMAEAQEAISRAAGRVNQYEDAKDVIETRLKHAPREEPRTYQTDPVEQFASTLAPRAASWIRSHPECVTNDAKRFRMFAAHHEAVGEGYKEGSEEYFNYLNENLGYSAKKDPVEQPKKDPPVQPRKTRTAAPPSREPSSQGGSSGRTETLTKEEVEMAELMGMTAKEYAIHKRALREAGKLGERSN